VLHPNLSGPLEVELFSGASDATQADRFEFLDNLVAAGLAERAKVEVLRNAGLEPACEDELGQVVARAWYVKLRFGDLDTCDAKAYFGLMPRLLRARTIVT
jgi:hypothetical protein